MPENECLVVAPFPSGTKSSVRKSIRSARLGRKAELVPLKGRSVETPLEERLVETPNVTNDCVCSGIELNAIMELHLASKAMAFYNKRHKDAEFEIVEVFYHAFKRVGLPRQEKSCKTWLHVSFTAKPKHADCSDVSPKYFFAELSRGDSAAQSHTRYCYTYEPSVDPEFNNGCIICRGDENLHPAADVYKVGHPPYYDASSDEG